MGGYKVTPSAVLPTTTTDPIDVGFWPSNANTFLPHGGVAHGIYDPAKLSTANSAGAVHHRLCVRATHTGTWDGFDLHLRTPSSSDMGVPSSQAHIERWRAHPLGSYCSGNGGSYKMRVYHWNPVTRTMGALVGESTTNYVHWPLDEIGNSVRQNRYKGMSVPVVAGNYYILEFENETPPPVPGRFIANDLTEAQAWGNNVGYMTMNGGQRPDRHADDGIRAGALGGEDYQRHWLSNDFVNWSEWTRECPMFQMSYADGVEAGYIYTIYDNVSLNDPKTVRTIGGDVMVRQRIPYVHPYGGVMPTRTFDKFEIYHGHHGADGVPSGHMEAKIIVNGANLAVARYDALPDMHTLSNQGGNARAQTRRAMRIADLSADVRLEDGDDVIYEYSGTTNAKFRMFLFLLLNTMKPHDTRECLNNDTTIYAEVSEDGGATWNKFSSGSFAKDVYGMMYAKGLTYSPDGYINGGTLV